MEHSVSTIMYGVLLKYILKKGGTPRSFLHDLPTEEILMSEKESVPLQVFHTLLERVSDEYYEDNGPFIAGRLIVTEHLKRSVGLFSRCIFLPRLFNMKKVLK
ncbi:MAG: hypothetical protein AB9903_28645 [Vulcanimicrobiota bacterium]